MTGQNPDSIIYDGLKAAIIEAFFKQQQRFDQNGYASYYGGTAVQLVENILRDKKFQAILDEIVAELPSHKEAIDALIRESLIQKAEKTIEQQFTDGRGSGYYFSEAITSALRAKVAEVAKDVAETNHEHFRQIVFKQLGEGAWDIKVNVSVTVTEKKEK